MGKIAYWLAAFFNGPGRISFSINASKIGAGKLNNSLRRLIFKVLKSAVNADVLEKKVSKCLKPTHGLPKIPFPILKSLNAKISPYIGPYEKTKINKKPGRNISNLALFAFTLCQKDILRLFNNLFEYM